MPTAEIATAVVSFVVGAVTVWTWLRRDKREAVDSERRASDRTIELLEVQNQLIETQNDDLRLTLARREQEWERRETAFEERITGLESWMRDEIAARVQLGMCRAATTCTEFDPCDRETVR